MNSAAEIEKNAPCARGEAVGEKRVKTVACRDERLRGVPDVAGATAIPPSVRGAVPVMVCTPRGRSRTSGLTTTA
jgi:hypothetical protein